MHTLDLGNVRSLLCLGAHADDIEIGCGGTLLRLLEAQPSLQVQWTVFSAAGIRRQEAVHSAAAFLGPLDERTIDVADFADRRFPTQWGHVKDYFDQLRERCPAPDLIFTHRREDAHQDHRVISELTWCTFRDHLVLEYEIPKYEGDLGQPNVLVRLTGEQAQRKAQLIHDQFPSQRDKRWFAPETFLSLARMRGLEAGAAFAEGFYARKIVF